MRIQEFLHIKHSNLGQSFTDKINSVRKRKEPTGNTSSPRSAPGKKGLFGSDREFLKRHQKLRREVK